MLKTTRTRRSFSPFVWVGLFLLAALGAVWFYSVSPLGHSTRDRSLYSIDISSNTSLIHVGSHDSFASTPEGIQAARTTLKALETKDLGVAKTAIAAYDKIIPVENYGGEYTALQWFCWYLVASDTDKAKMVKDPMVASFHQFFAENDYARLKEYIKRKYKLADYPDKATEAGQNRKAFLEDSILFNNPRREEWEKTSKIMSTIALKPGQTIADIGSGPGYYTFQFSKLVGNQGRVYAIDTVKEHLNYVDETAKKYGITNVKTINNNTDTIGVSPEQADVAFLCSLYHNIYAMSLEDERKNFVNSIHKALKKDGTLIVVDNALVKDSELPYHGPYIAKELIIGQLQHEGFKFVQEHQYIPQRYILTFKKA